MARYLLQGAYTSEAWASLLKNPQDRTQAASRLVESVGGTLESAYLTFGEYDFVIIMDMPDNMSAAAASMVLSAGGAVKAVRTTPLMTIEEGIEAMRKGGTAAGSYRPPSA